jgi:hypothetical protein
MRRTRGVDEVKNLSGQWEGPDGGSSMGALCTKFTLVNINFQLSFMFIVSIQNIGLKVQIKGICLLFCMWAPLLWAGWISAFLLANFCQNLTRKIWFHTRVFLQDFQWKKWSKFARFQSKDFQIIRFSWEVPVRSKKYRKVLLFSIFVSAI